MIYNLQQICAYQIVKSPEKYGQELRKFPRKDQQAINSLCLLWSQAALLFPTKEELKKGLYLVHATDFFPKKAVLKAGSYNKVTQQFETKRKTVHFSLNHVVQPHGSNNWDDSKFAFIIPLDEEKLINLYPADNFCLGDFKLNSESFCVTHEGNRKQTLKNNWPENRLILFKSGTLREAVNQAIKDKRGWSIQTKKEQGYAGMHARLKEGPYRFFDLSQTYFYSSILNDHKDLSFGPCIDTLGYAGLVKQFELSLFSGFNFYDHAKDCLLIFPPSLLQINFLCRVIPELLENFSFIEFVSSRLEKSHYNEWLSWAFASLHFMMLDLNCGNPKMFALR